MKRSTWLYIGQIVSTFAVMSVVDGYIKSDGAPINALFPLGRLTFIAFSCMGLGFSAAALYSTFRDMKGIYLAKFNGPSQALASGRRMAATYRLLAMIYLYSLALNTGVTVAVPTVIVVRLVWWHVAVATLLLFNSVADLITSISVQRAVDHQMASQ